MGILDVLKSFRLTVPGETKRAIKVAAIIYIVEQYTGQSPIVEEFPGYTYIKFTPNQIEKLQQILKNWMDAAPGEIRVDVQPVLLPFFLKRWWYWLGATAVAGFGIGKIKIRGR